MRPTTRVLVAQGVIVLALVGSVVLQLVLNHNITQSTFEVRESQYRACVVNGNTLRDQVRREFIDIKRKVLIPTFSQVAATIPQGATSRMILEAEVDYMKRRIKTIKHRLPDVDCLSVYPPLNGQVYPQIKPPQNPTEDTHPHLGPKPPQLPN